jgi:type IX secretion system PorP/SprF family membrane protein
MIKKYLMHVKFHLKFVFALVFCCGLSLKFGLITGQDVHFSQFDYAPLFINPANTGDFKGDFRVAGNFRNQLSGSANPYRTELISFDKQVFLLGQKLGIGAFFLNDEADPGKLTFDKLYASLAYNAVVNNNGIGIGFQAGYAFGKTNTNWGVFDNGAGTFTGPNGEEITSANFLDINLGLNYTRSIGIFQPEVGLSLSHINKPTMSFIDDKSEKENLKFLIYTTVKTNVNDKLSIAPKFYLSSKDATSENIFGAEVDYNLIGYKTTVKKVFCGAYLRNNSSGKNAFIAQAGATVGRLDIGISYDMYLSNVTNSGIRSAFEISFIYKSISTILNSYSIPCERY